MKVRDMTELAVRNLRESMLRNSLTTLGVAVGVAAEERIEPTSLCECIATLKTVTLPESKLLDSVPARVRRAFASVVMVSG